MPKLTFLFQCREQAAENAPGTRMPCQAFTRKTKIIITSSWQSDCLSPQAFCHLAGHVLGSAKSVALRRRGSHANCWPPASFVSSLDAPRTTAGSLAGRRRRELPAGIVNLPNCVCRDKRNPEAAMPMRGSMPCWARNRSANKRVPEPTSRIRMVCLAISRGEIERCLARG